MFCDWRAVSWWPASSSAMRGTRSSKRASNGSDASQKRYLVDASASRHAKPSTYVPGSMGLGGRGPEGTPPTAALDGV